MTDSRENSHLRPFPDGYRMVLFGGPELCLHEKPIPLSPLQRALLGILYGSKGNGLDREEILGLVWPEDPPSRARRRLNQLLYSIKRRTGSSTLFESLGQRILQVPRTVSSDLDAYRVAFREEHLGRCAEILSRGFLRRSLGQTSQPLTHWIEARERELRGALGRRLRDALAEREEKADWPGALDAAEGILLLSPLDESALVNVMKARARVSGSAEADAAFVDFAARREATLGSPWVPDDETLSLLERIRTDLGSTSADNPENEQTIQPEPRLVGRDVERAHLRRALEAPPAETLRGILVTGEAGIGKTRLIRESVFSLRLEGQAVFLADQAELEQLIPLNPLIEVLRSAQVGDTLCDLDEPWRAVLYGVMPSHFRQDGPIPQAPQIQAGSVPRRLFEAFHQLLLRLVEDAPLILVFENLQWADETTLSVLEFLIKRWDRGRLQAVFSLRSEEIRKTSALQTFLESLRLHEDFLELPLADLDDTDSETLIKDLSGRPLSSGEVRHLHSLAGGNPFFLIELTLEYLAGRVDQPSLPREVISIPLSIRQVLDRRLSQLSAGAEKALGALAVHSRGLRVEDLAQAADLTVSECLSGLKQLHDFRLVRSVGAEVSVSHELIRQTVYQGMASSTKAWLHRRVARHLRELSPGPPPDELAIHYHFADATEEALLFSREAATRAEASGAIPEALRFLGIARQHTNSPKDVAEIIGRMGHLNYLHQNLEEAAPLLESAASRYRGQGRDAEALEAELERVDSLGQTGFLPSPDCLEELDRIKTEAKKRDLWETYMKALDVAIHFYNRSDDYQGIQRVLSEARIYSNRGGSGARCHSRSILALNVYFGCPNDGLTAAREAVEIALGTRDRDLELHALNRLIVVLLYQGRLHSKEGVRAFAEAEERLGSSGDLIRKFFVRLNRVVWHLEVGELEKAVSAIPAVQDVIKGTRARDPRAMFLLNRGELEFELDDVVSARESFARAFSLLSESSPIFFRTIITSGLGLCALREGDLREAKRLEATLPKLPKHWTFDPSVVVSFKAEMFRMRGDLQMASRFLEEVADGIKDRLVTAWIKINILRAKILRRTDRKSTHTVAFETLARTQSLGLRVRSAELARFLD